MTYDKSIEYLVGKTLTSCERGEVRGEDAIIFTLEDGSKYAIYHRQSCCENVYIDDICGELADLVGSPISHAYESTNSEDPKFDFHESFTWTFYRIGTLQGSVTIKFYGSSNGYYSESASFNVVE